MDNYALLTFRTWPLKRLDEASCDWSVDVMFFSQYCFTQQPKCERSVAHRLLRVLPSLTPPIV